MRVRRRVVALRRAIAAPLRVIPRHGAAMRAGGRASARSYVICIRREIISLKN